MSSGLRVTPRRPGVVTFIGVIIVIQGVLALVAAAAVLISNNSDRIQAATNQTSHALIGAGIAEAIVGVIYLDVGYGLLSGSRMSRFIIALTQGIGMALATWLLFTHHAGGYTTRALVTLGIGAFVIWALYGHEESDEYFELTR